MSIVGIESTVDAIEGAKMESNRPRSLRIGFWGTPSIFSTHALMVLLKEYSLTHVALPATEPVVDAVTALSPPATALADLLILNPGFALNPVSLAWQQGIPAYQVHHLRSSSVYTWLAGLALDVVCVACFPWRIPPTLLRLPTYGFLNIHPSLLPAYRGPAPLFWQLRAGLREIGVTVHWMDADFDTGKIAAQSSVTLPDGASGPVADQWCAATGAALLCQVLQQLAQTPPPTLSPVPPVGEIQPSGGSYQSWPTAADFRLCRHWSAQHAYNFMRGTAEWQQPYPILLADEELWLRTALAYDATQSLTAPYVRTGSEIRIGFQPGVLQALVW